MELWDLYDKDRKPLGRLHKRGEPLPKGTYHIVVSVLTLNLKGQILITLRDYDKNPYPALWEITAGSAIAGEDSRTAAKRELSEETGIDITDDELEFAHTYVSGGGSGSIVDMYIVRKNIGINKVHLQNGETVAVKWAFPEEFEKLIEEHKVTPPVARRYEIYKPLLENIH